MKIKDVDKKMGEKSTMLRNPKVLFLTEDPSENSAIHSLLQKHVNLTRASSVGEMREKLTADEFDAMFCPWSLRENALQETRGSYPNLPVIVFSPKASMNEWAEILDAGAFDMLVPPYEGRSMLAVLEQAKASREAVSQRETDRHLTVVA